MRSAVAPVRLPPSIYHMVDRDGARGAYPSAVHRRRPGREPRILVTGATGFLGTALVERLLRSVPDCEVVVLVRPTRRLVGSRADPA